jgi:hypothetical protein
LGTFWRALEWKRLVCIFLGHFKCMTAIWYILWSFGNLMAIWYIVPCFGILCREWSGSPEENWRCSCLHRCRAEPQTFCKRSVQRFFSQPFLSSCSTIAYSSCFWPPSPDPGLSKTSRKIRCHYRGHRYDHHFRPFWPSLF